MAEQAIKLVYKFKKGDALKYKTTIESQVEIREDASSETVSTVMTMLTAQEVTDIQKDDVSVLKVTVQDARLTKDGEEIVMPPITQSAVIQMRTSGQILEIAGVLPQSSGGTPPSFPEEPIAPGSKWQSENPVQMGDGLPPAKIVNSYVFDGLEKKLGYDCALIRMNSSELVIPIPDGGRQKMKITGHTFFAHKEGKLISSKIISEALTVLSPRSQVSAKTDMTVELLEKAESLPQGEFLISS
ncbi:MAG: hypothetical protein HYU64_09930 [Armatimonadetes bacterium]|nr:hypothetical protein [Armatimonadota bacterium]